MSMLSRQRRVCQELALAARQDRDEIELAQARLVSRLRQEVGSPLGLAAFFVAGLLVGRLALKDDSQEPEAGGVSRARLVGLGRTALRLGRVLGAV